MASALSSQDVERYSRQIMLKEIGALGQQRLSAATVLVAGIGAMGGAALLYLAGAGVGRLLLLDTDCEHTFAAGHRLLHAVSRPGVPAHVIAAETLVGLNPHIIVQPLAPGLEVLSQYVGGCQLVVDASGNDEWQQRINALCYPAAIPVLTGQVTQEWVQLRKALPPSPCLHCQTQKAPPTTPLTSGAEDWQELGAGLAGCLLAEEALLTLLGVANRPPWHFLNSHLPSGIQQTALAERDPACPLCSHLLHSPYPPPEATPAALPWVDAEIDITQEACPMTFVKVKLKLESMPPSSRLRIRLRGAEPLANVPLTLRNEGYAVSAPQQMAGEIFVMDVVKPQSQ